MLVQRERRHHIELQSLISLTKYSEDDYNGSTGFILYPNEGEVPRLNSQESPGGAYPPVRVECEWLELSKGYAIVEMELSRVPREIWGLVEID